MQLCRSETETPTGSKILTVASGESGQLCKLRNVKIPLQNYKTTKLQNYKTAKLQNCKTAKLQKRKTCKTS